MTEQLQRLAIEQEHLLQALQSETLGAIEKPRTDVESDAFFGPCSLFNPVDAHMGMRLSLVPQYGKIQSKEDILPRRSQYFRTGEVRKNTERDQDDDGTS